MNTMGVIGYYSVLFININIQWYFNWEYSLIGSWNININWEYSLIGSWEY